MKTSAALFEGVNSLLTNVGTQTREPHSPLYVVCSQKISVLFSLASWITMLRMTSCRVSSRRINSRGNVFHGMICW